MISENMYARAYARALLGVAQANRSVERVTQDMHALEQQWQGSAELRNLCFSRRAGMLFLRQHLGRQIWGSTFTDAVLTFMDRLAEMGHLRLIPQITARFQELADRAAGCYAVEVTFACEPRESEVSNIRQMVAAAYGPVYKFSAHVEPALLAGVRIRIDDRLVDASLAGRIARLKNGLLNPTRPVTAATGEDEESL